MTTDQLLFGDPKSYALASIKDLELIKMVKRLEDLDEKRKEKGKDLIACSLFRKDTPLPRESSPWLRSTWNAWGHAQQRGSGTGTY